MAYTFGGTAADGVDDVDKTVEGIKANWTAKKGYGAIELKHRTFRITLHPN